MPTFEVTSPDGKTFEITAPDGTTQEQALEYAKRQFATKQPVTVGPESFKQSLKETIESDVFPAGAKFVAGLGNVISDPALRLKQIFQGLTPEERNRALAQREINSTLAGALGNITGNVMSIGPAVGLATGAAGSAAGRVLPSLVAPTVGAAAVNAAVAPVSAPLMDGETAGGAAVRGAVGGALGDVGARTAARVVQPIIQSQAVQNLTSRGVIPSPGQAAGGFLNDAEQKATSVFLLGDVIRKARARPTEELNRATYQAALSPIGEKSTAQIGREGVEEVADKLSAKYQQLLPNLSFKADRQFSAELQKIQAMASTLPTAQANRFEQVLREQVISKLTPNGMASGETLKQIESQLSRMARGYSSSADFDQRQLGAALGEINNSIRNTLVRANPQYADELSKINLGWSIYARIRDAASNINAKEGVFNARQLASAIRRGDSTVGKGNYAKGDALMQKELSDPAMSVLSSTVPNSGTVDRAMMLYLLGGGIAGANSYLGGPEFLTAAALAPMLYSRPSIRYMVGGYPGQNAISQTLRDLSPYAAQAGGILAREK